MTAAAVEPGAPGLPSTLRSWATPHGSKVRWFASRTVVLVAVAVLVSAPFWLSPGDEYSAGLAVIAILLALSFNLMLGGTGMVSFGHAAFYGIGAFTVALFVTKMHGDALVGLALAPFIGAAAGVAFGAFCLRASRLYFSLLTLAVSQLLYVAAFQAYSITGGDNGIHGITVPDFLNDPTTSYYFVLGVVAVGAVVLLVVRLSPFGAALGAIRENRQRAAFIGISVKLYELAAFTIASSLAAVAGALYAIYDQQAFPGLMFWTESGTPVLMALIGGFRTFLGPAFGAVFYTILAVKVKNGFVYWDLVIGGVLLGVVLLLPGGLAGAPATIRGALGRLRRRDRMAPAAEESVAGLDPAATELEALSAVVDTAAVARTRPVPADGKPILEVHGLSRSFGGLAAVDGVNLHVPEGGVQAVIGPNGAGKSTLFNLISGYLKPDSGRVEFDGADITGAAPQKLAHAGIGRSFQTTAVFPGLTLADNVRLAVMGIQGDTRIPVGLASRRHHARVQETLRAVGLEHLAQTTASELSHGDQRALELGISLALGARLLLLDEPTAGMSPYETRRTLELLRGLTAGQGVTLLITEHDMEVVFGIADRVTVMAEGRVLAEGTPEEVRNHPEVRRVYLGTEV